MNTYGKTGGVQAPGRLGVDKEYVRRYAGARAKTKVRPPGVLKGKQLQPKGLGIGATYR